MSVTETAAPANSLADLILALLAPMFLWSTAGDIRLAYTAAAQTVNEYRVTNRLSLMTVAKIIAFDIATLSSLSQSMYEDTPVLLGLRLRANANSLDRSGERNRRALEAASHTIAAGAAVEPVEVAVARAEQMVCDAKTRINAARSAEPEPAAHATPPAAAPATAEEPAWPAAISAVAEAFATDFETVPPERQWSEMARIMAMTTAAADIATGAAPPTAPATAAE